MGDDLPDVLGLPTVPADRLDAIAEVAGVERQSGKSDEAFRGRIAEAMTEPPAPDDTLTQLVSTVRGIIREAADDWDPARVRNAGEILLYEEYDDMTVTIAIPLLHLEHAGLTTEDVKDELDTYHTAPGVQITVRIADPP